jgi:hypothetical protein
LLPPYGDYSKSRIFARAIKDCGLERSLRCGIKPSFARLSNSGQAASRRGGEFGEDRSELFSTIDERFRALGNTLVVKAAQFDAPPLPGRGTVIGPDRWESMDGQTKREIWLLAIGTALVELPVAFTVFTILSH